jgi:alpha-tubulin suppressor-like RCC1 family protein
MSGLRVQQVACGGMSSMVLTDTGDVWAWGEPWGDFALTLSRAPTKVSDTGVKGVVEVWYCGVEAE